MSFHIFQLQSLQKCFCSLWFSFQAFLKMGKVHISLIHLSIGSWTCSKSFWRLCFERVNGHYIPRSGPPLDSWWKSYHFHITCMNWVSEAFAILAERLTLCTIVMLDIWNWFHLCLAWKKIHLTSSTSS